MDEAAAEPVASGEEPVWRLIHVVTLADARRERATGLAYRLVPQPSQAADNRIDLAARQAKKRACQRSADPHGLGLHLFEAGGQSWFQRPS
jgi:hypothetical protein